MLTHSHVIRIEYLRQFWAIMHLDCEPTPAVLRTWVNNTDIVFSCADLRHILHLGTVVEEDGPTEFPLDMRAGGFLQMGYAGDVTKSQFTKSYLYGQWR